MNFFTPMLEGLITGIGLSLTLGTVFFALIQNSIVFGYRKGILIAYGVMLSDILLVSLVLWSNTFILLLENYSKSATLIGAALLLGYGFFQINKRTKFERENKNHEGALLKNVFFVGKGILLNIINPVNFFIWISISAMLTAKFHYGLTEKIFFFGASIFAIFSTEVLLSIFASRIRKFMNDNRVQWVNKISGVIFIGIGMYLLFS